jgi:hypothetical protein
VYIILLLLYIIYYYKSLYYYILFSYFTIILILYSPLLFILSSSSSLLILLQFYSFLSFILYLSVLTYTYTILSFFLLNNLIPFRWGIHTPILLFPSSVLSSVLFRSISHSFYTCRYLHILIYIHLLQFYSFLLLSLPISQSSFDPARSIGVDG